MRGFVIVCSVKNESLQGNYIRFVKKPYRFPKCPGDGPFSGPGDVSGSRLFQTKSEAID